MSMDGSGGPLLLWRLIVRSADKTWRLYNCRAWAVGCGTVFRIGILEMGFPGPGMSGASIVSTESTRDIFMPFDHTSFELFLNVDKVSLANADRNRIVVHPAIEEENIPFAFAGTSLLHRSLCSAGALFGDFLAPRTLPGDLLASRHGRDVGIGLRLGDESRPCRAFWTGGRSVVQGRPQIQIFEVAEQHVPGM